VLLLAAGCTTDGRRDGRTDDPLLGSGLRPGGQPVAVATATPTGTALGPPPPAYQPQPPLTVAIPTSNAALAGGFQPLPGGNDLRIGNGAPAPAAPAGSPSAVAVPVPVPPPGAAAAPPPAVSSGGGTLEQAYAAVAARNPLWHRMKFNGQTREYTFEMSLPSKLNTSVQRTVEATAATPDAAIRRALEQLGNDP
jgi:hypothetical protein